MNFGCWMGWDWMDGMDGMGWEETDGMIPHTRTYAWICDDDLIPRMGKGVWTHTRYIYLPMQGGWMRWDGWSAFLAGLCILLAIGDTSQLLGHTMIPHRRSLRDDE